MPRKIWLQDIFREISSEYVRSKQQDKLRELANRLIKHLLECPDIGTRLRYVEGTARSNFCMLRANQLLHTDFSTIAVYHFQSRPLLTSIYSMSKLIHDLDYTKLLLRLRAEVPEFLINVDAHYFFSYVLSKDHHALLFYIDYFYSDRQLISAQEKHNVVIWLSGCCLCVTFDEAWESHLDSHRILLNRDIPIPMPFSAFRRIIQSFARYKIIPRNAGIGNCLDKARNAVDLEAAIDLFVPIIQSMSQNELFHMIIRSICRNVNETNTNLYIELFCRLKQKCIEINRGHLIHLLLNRWNVPNDTLLPMCRYVNTGPDDLEKYIFILHRIRHFCSATKLDAIFVITTLFEGTGEHILHGLDMDFQLTIRCQASPYRIYGMYADRAVVHFVHIMATLFAGVGLDQQLKMMANACHICRLLIDSAQ